MELSILKHPDQVIALDIGSTYSGYAWQSKGEFETNRNDINFNTNWGAGALQLHKTKTCILIQKKKDKPNIRLTEERRENESKFSLDNASIEKIRFGHDAEKVYMNLAKRKRDELLGNYYLFSRFKLLLYGEAFNDEQLVEDQLSQHLPLFDVMTLFIKALKDHCLNKISTMGITINIQKTLFVVTVPAIWSDEAKEFMRKAAVKAGIGNKNVLLVLEPEAAAISCIHLPKQQCESMNNFGEKGQKFLVADLGGGTADLSAVEVENSGSLKELCKPTGSRVGGQNINEAFLQVCHDSFEGEKWKQIFAEATPVDMLKMEADFELKKVTIGLEDVDAENIDLAIPEPVRKGLENRAIQLKQGASVRYEDHDFLFDSAFVRENLFDTTCREIYYNTIKKVLDMPEAHGISTVILVGGFAESPIVANGIRQMITEDFPDVKVVVPYSPFKAILQGAVLYGHDFQIFSSRISRLTYGVKVNRIFKATKHDRSKKWKNEETGEFFCKDVFDIHVKKGQSVRLLDEQPECSYNPMFKEQKTAGIEIYASSSLNPMYITDEGCRPIGKVHVEMPDTTGGSKRTIKVNMIYGGSELSVIAKDTTTGKQFNAGIQFNTA